MLEIAAAVTLWNQLLDLSGAVNGGVRISDDRIWAGNNIIVEGECSLLPDLRRSFTATRCLFVVRPELAYSNELSSLGSVQNFSSTSIEIDMGINLNESALLAATSAEEKNLKIQKAMLSDIYGNQTLLLEIEDQLGMEFRSFGTKTPSPNDAKLFLMYCFLDGSSSKSSKARFHLTSQ